MISLDLYAAFLLVLYYSYSALIVGFSRIGSSHALYSFKIVCVLFEWCLYMALKCFGTGDKKFKCIII